MEFFFFVMEFFFFVVEFFCNGKKVFVMVYVPMQNKKDKVTIIEIKNNN